MPLASERWCPICRRLVPHSVYIGLEGKVQSTTCNRCLHTCYLWAEP